MSSSNEPIRIAHAVHALLGRAHERRHLGQGGRGGQDPLADQRVAAHEAPLLVVQRAGLAEDRVRDRELADLVQLGGQRDVRELVVREAELDADRRTSSTSPLRWPCNRASRS